MRIVVEGSGTWAMQYFQALKAHAGRDTGVWFTYDSTFGLDRDAARQHAQLAADHLQVTLRNVAQVQDAGFASVDVKDTLFKGRRNPLRDVFPHDVDAVFVVTPDKTHCDVAQFWLGRAKRIFVEKPFDVSADRIRRFRECVTAQTTSEVFGVDHYFVRCNQAAFSQDYFIKHLLDATAGGGLLGDFTGFEFCLTEPPMITRGRYDATAVRKRAPSLQGGMVFDLGAHAVPILMPFFDLSAGIRLRKVWAGRCDGLRDVIYSGAETFSIAHVECRTQRTRTKQTSAFIPGTFIVGKDVGDRPQKYFVLKGPRGEVRFDLVRYRVDHTSPTGEVTSLGPLFENWTSFFVEEILKGRVPRAVETFRPSRAEVVVKFLETWRDACQRHAQGQPRTLKEHTPGMPASLLQAPSYQVS